MSARRVVAWLVVVAVGVLASARALAAPLGAPDPTRANAQLTAGQDFRDATYFPLRELFAGGDPYLPANMFDAWPVRQEFALYAPSHLSLHAPLALLEYRPALVVFSLLALACLFATGIVAARTYRLPGGWATAWFAGALVVVSQPGKSAVYLGQINPLVGLGAMLALTQARRHPGWAVVGLALAWIKPQYGIPLTVLLLATRARREAVGGTTLALLLSLPTLAVLLAREGVSGFVDVVRANLAYSSTISYTAVDSPTGERVDGAAVLSRLTGWSPPGLEVVLLVLVLGTAVVVLRRLRTDGPLTAREQLVAASAILICVVHQPSETLLAVGAITAIVAALLTRRPVPVPVLVAAALMLLPFAHVGAVGLVVETVLGARVENLWEGVALNVAFWVVAVASLRERRARPVVEAERGTT